MPSLTVHGALRAVISLPMLLAPLMITVVTFAAPAAAQETPAENAPLQEVVVTGIRRGIEDAIKVKEDSGSIVEAISAEDIGKLPDTSIAESISRLPYSSGRIVRSSMVPASPWPMSRASGVL